MNECQKLLKSDNYFSPYRQ